MARTEIISPDSPDLLAQVALIFNEYAQSLSIDLGFQGFEQELATLRDVHEVVQQPVGIGRAVVFCNVVKQGFQVLLCTLGEQHFISVRRVSHARSMTQALGCLARKRFTTSVSGLVLPSATSWLPKANNFNKAKVSWVSS